MPFILLSTMVKAYDKFLHCIPFLLMVRSKDDKLELKLDLNAITTAVVIAVLTAMVVNWSSKDRMSKIETELTTMREETAAMKKRLTDFGLKFDKLYDDVYAPIIPEPPKGRK